MRSQAVSFEKAVDFRAKKKSVIITISLDIKKSVLICANLWTERSQTTDGFYRPQISTDWHRLRAEGSD